MGWDAYSSAERNHEAKKLLYPELDRLFKNAEAYVFKKTGKVDGLLSVAGLDFN